MDFLKKKTFEEFKNEGIFVTGGKSGASEDVFFHKTPVTPWGDGKAFVQPDVGTAGDKTFGGSGANFSKPKVQKGLGTYFSKEHNEEVIGKYGGFTSGMEELRKAHKQAGKTQNLEGEYRVLYGDSDGKQKANQAGGY